MPTGPRDPRLDALLEAAYGELCAGNEPDLAAICRAAPELQSTLAGILQRERDLFAACGPQASAPADSPALASMPQRLAEFTLLEPIGVGGMSQVFRARQEPFGREVALKVLRPELVAGNTGRLRFSREASITAALDHPHIVPVYAAGEAEGQVYLAMKLLRGRSLEHLAAPLPPRDVARLGADCSSALAAAHAIGVVHRDIKPANIVLEHDHAYVVDFGLAAFLHQASFLTQPHSTPGTLVYLAPELVRSRGAALDPRVDIYSLGATLYELLAGRPPFDPSSPVRLLQQILHADPAPLQLRGVDRDLEVLVLRAMDKNPERRFASAAEFGDELERYLAGQAIRSRPPSLLRRFGRWIRRHPAATTAMAGVLVAAGIAGGMWTRERLQQEQRIARALSSLDRALASGDLPAARGQLDALAAAPAPTAAQTDAAAAVAGEAQLQLLIAVLQQPLARHDPGLLQALLHELDTAPPRITGSRRAGAARAIASRMVSNDAVTHRPLDDATRAGWPRFAAALAQFVVRPAERTLPTTAGVDAFDHLFTAIVLRLLDQPEPVIEAELRRAPWQADAAPALQHALALSFEHQGRHASAYDLLRQLAEGTAAGPLASAACARLAATLGRGREARRWLDHTAAAGSADALVQRVTQLSELQVLDELGEDAAFWRRFEQAANTADALPQYWLRGGYAAARSAVDDPAAAARALAMFRTGLERHPDPARRAALEIAMLQVEWLRQPAAASLDPVPDDDEQRPALQALATAAEATAAAAKAAHLDRLVVADALVVAAKARRALGELASAWTLLERACLDHAEADALSTHANWVGYRVAQAQLGPAGAEDSEVEHTAPLVTAAATALAHARQVLAQANELSLDPGLVDQAEQSAFLCALHLGEGPSALRSALSLRTRADLAPAVMDLCAIAVDWGGLRLDRLELPPARVQALLLATRTALDDELAGSRLTAAERDAALDRWRKALATTRGQPGWQSVWSAIEPLPSGR